MQLAVDDNPPLSQPFTIRKDPRLAQVSARDIQRQFEFGTKVVARTSAADQAVINIQACNSQIADRIGAANDPQVTESGRRVEGKLDRVSGELHQPNQQLDKFPVRLNEKIDNLLGVSESADGLPTVQTVEVFEVLDRQLTAQLTTLGHVIDSDVARFNRLLQQHGLQPISCQG